MESNRPRARSSTLARRRSFALNQAWKNCAWVAGNPGARCDKSIKGGETADEACPVACDTCPPVPTQTPTEAPTGFTCEDWECENCLFLMTDGARGCMEGGYGESQKKCDNKPSNNDKWDVTIWCGPTETPTEAPTDTPTNTPTDTPTDEPTFSPTHSRELPGSLCVDSDTWHKDGNPNENCAYFRRAELPLMNRGDAAVATRIVRRDESPRPRRQ